MKRTETAELLGLSFDAVTIETAVARCLEFCRGPPSSHTVITANASHLCMMRHDPELARACRAAHLTLADGMSVVWALRASGQPAPERVAGVDLMARLLAAAGEHRLRVYFLGARREVVTALVETSRAQHPGIEIEPVLDLTPCQLLAAIEQVGGGERARLAAGQQPPTHVFQCCADVNAGHDRAQSSEPAARAGAGAGGDELVCVSETRLT